MYEARDLIEKFDLFKNEQRDMLKIKFETEIKPPVSETVEKHREAVQTQRQDTRAMNAPEWQAQRTPIMEQRLASFKTVKTVITGVLRDLYATLNNSQKEKADDLLRHGEFGAH